MKAGPHRAVRSGSSPLRFGAPAVSPPRLRIATAAVFGLIALTLVGGVLHLVREDPPADAIRSFDIWVAGDNTHVYVTVDPAQGVAWVQGGDGTPAQMFITVDLVILPADSLSTSAAAELGSEWVAWRIREFGGLGVPPDPHQLISAFALGVKACTSPSAAAQFVSQAFLAHDATVDGVSLCDKRVGAAADDGGDLLVTRAAGSTISVPAADAIHVLDGPEFARLADELRAALGM